MSVAYAQSGDTVTLKNTQAGTNNCDGGLAIAITNPITLLRQSCGMLSPWGYFKGIDAKGVECYFQENEIQTIIQPSVVPIQTQTNEATVKRLNRVNGLEHKVELLTKALKWTEFLNVGIDTNEFRCLRCWGLKPKHTDTCPIKALLE